MATPNQIEKIALYAIARGASINYGKIAAALKNGLTVLADLHSGGSAFVVHDVRRSGTKDGCQVRVLEGWRSPLRVWTKEQPELPFYKQRAEGPLLHACGDPDCVVPHPAAHKQPPR